MLREWNVPREKRLHHLLFDCGLGVVDSLIDNGTDDVTQIFLSHNHADHVLELDRLVNSLRRSGSPTPFDVYCTQKTWDAGPYLHFHWLSQPPTPTLRHRLVTPNTPVALFGWGPGAVPLGDLGIGLRITPVDVWHGASAPEAVIWVVEFGSKEANTYRKLILMWDLLHLVPRHPNEDSDLNEAKVKADKKYSGTVAESNTLAEPLATLLKGANELFVEGNTYTPCPHTGHTSVEAALRFYVPILEPERTWIVHYSGHEDRFGPLSDDALQQRIDADNKTGKPIFVARHGMTLSWQV